MAMTIPKSRTVKRPSAMTAMGAQKRDSEEGKAGSSY